MYQQPPPQNLYPAQNGPIVGAEPLVPPTGQQIIPPPQSIPQGVQPIPASVQPVGAYVQPVYQNQNQPIIVNQLVPVNLIKFKTTPIAINCPYCKQNVTTVVTTEFNCLNCCFCCWNWVIWLIVQLVREKELNCTDATHKCPSCGKIVGQYNAC